MTKPAVVAKWMYDQIKAESVLHQSEVVYQIQEKFGEKFVYYNNNGNLAISKDVLKEFRVLSERDVVWERINRCWRLREPYDEKGKRQVD